MGGNRGLGWRHSLLGVLILSANVSARQAANPDPAKPKDATGKPPSEHIIYIPYSKLGEIFEKDGRNVLLPFAEYDRLWSIVRALGGVSKPPVPAVLTSLHYSGAVEGDVATLKATLLLDVLTDDWVKFPMAFKDAAVSKVEGATLAADGVGRYLLVLKGKQRHTVTFELAAPVIRSPEGRKLALTGPLAGSTSLAVTLPDDGVDVEVTPKLATVKRTGTAKQTTVEASLGATDMLAVAWRAKTEMQVAKALLIANRQTLITVGDGVVHDKTKIDYQVLRGEVGELGFALGVGDKLLDLKAPGLRDWRVLPGGGPPSIRARLHAPVTKSVQLEIDTERPIPTGKFPVATIRAQDVERETGVVAVAPGEELSLLVADRRGLTRVAPQEMPSELVRPNGFFHKFFTADHVLTIETAAVAPRLAVEEKLLYRLDEGRLRGTATFAYDIQRAGVFALRIRLPAGVDLEQVNCPAMERYEVVPDAGGPILHLPLRQKALGSLAVTVQFSQARGDAAASLKPPLPVPLDVAVERGLIAVLAHESFEVNRDDAQMKGLIPSTKVELAQQGFHIPSEPRMNLVAAFRFPNRPIDLGFNVVRRQTRIVADTFVRIHVKENALINHTVLAYDVQYAGASQFEFLVPEALSDRIEVTGANIKEKKGKGAKAVDGFVRWTVVLDSRALGRHVLLIKSETPIKLNQSGASTLESAVQWIQPEHIERENGQVAVSKERTLLLEDTPDNLEPIDPRQLAMPSEATTTFGKEAPEIQLAYRYYRHPARLKLKISKHEIQRVVETIVTRTLIDAVVPYQGAITYRALFLIKSSQRQRLKVALPTGAKILGINVAGRTVLPEKDPAGKGNDYLVNVGRNTGPDDPFAMTMLYEQPRDGQQLEWSTFAPGALPALTLGAPQFGGDVTHQRTFWRIWLPGRYTAVGQPDGFNVESRGGTPLLQGVGAPTGSPGDVEIWLAEWNRLPGQNVFEFPTVGRLFAYSSLLHQGTLRLRYGYVPAMILAASLAVLLGFLATLRLRLESKISLVLLVGVAILLGALFAPDSVMRWSAAAGIGTAFGAAFWIGHWLLWVRRNLAQMTWRRPGPSPTAPVPSASAPIPDAGVSNVEGTSP